MSEETLVASPDGTRMAYTVLSGQGLAVVVDSIQGPHFDGIADGSLVFSSNGSRFGYVGTRPGKQFVVVDGEFFEYDGVSKHGVLFSPNGERQAWVAARDGSQFAVIDGKESAPYEGILPAGVLFSADSKHCAFSAHMGEQDVVVIDGAEGQMFDDVDGFAFTANGQHSVYIGKREAHWYGVIDGVPCGPYDKLRQSGGGNANKDSPPRVFEMSADGSRVGFVAKRGEDWFVIVDGKELGPFKGCGGLTLSPDGSRAAYMATYGADWFIMVEGGEEKYSKGLQTFTLSPEGKHTAATVKRGDKVLAVLDGVEGKEYDRIDEPGVLFSSDGKHTAYVALLGGEKLVVTDTKEGEPFLHLGKSGLGFIPNSSRVVYSIQRGEREVVVVDGVPGPQVLSFRSLSFSPDGSRYAYGAEKADSHWTVIVDGAEYGPGGPLKPGEEATYQWVGKRTPHFSPDGKHVAWVGVRNDRFVVVVDGVESREYDAIMRNTLDFTLDSQHVVYLAGQGDKKLIVVDGFEIDNGWKGFLRDSELVFNGSKHFSIRGSRNPRLLLIEVEIL